MLDNYLIVHKSLLPDCVEKVLEVRHILDRGEAKDVTEAIKIAGISRTTYYKYKDMVLEPSMLNRGRTAVITTVLSHEPGTLSDLLARISSAGCSIITITQAVPINGKAGLIISLDISNINTSPDEFFKSLGAKLLAME